MQPLVVFKCTFPSVESFAPFSHFLTTECELRPPVAVALRLGKLNIARFLHSRGADVDSTDLDGWTPLLYLFFLYSKDNRQIVESIEFLASASSFDVNAQGFDGKTSLHYAAAQGEPPDILDLLRRNASLSSKTESLQRSPIFEAVSHRNFATFEVLADHQPDYFKENDIQGWTLLHLAASSFRAHALNQEDFRNIVARLLRDGADVHALTDARATINMPKMSLGRSLTPLDVARASGSKHFKLILEVLKEWDEDVRVIWEGCECDRLFWDRIGDVCEKCDECDVFFPSLSF